MEIDKMIREIADEVMKNIHTNDNASSSANRNSAFDLPAGRGGSVFDMGPYAAEMRRETVGVKNTIGGSAFDCHYSAHTNKADFAFSTPARSCGSAFDYQTHR